MHPSQVMMETEHMKITDSLHAIRVPFQVPISPSTMVARFVSVYLLTGKKISLVDSGVAAAKSTIFESIEALGFSPKDISTVILTHSHPDHIGAARMIKEETECAVLAHRAEIPWIEDVALQEKERPVPGFRSLVSGSVKVDRALRDGDVLDVESKRISVVHTPGHSAGSISLFIRDEGVLLSGDCILLAGEMPVYDDFRSTLRSLRRLREIEGIEVLLSSWDQPRKGAEVYRVMDESIDYLERIDAAVREISPETPDNPMELCRRMVQKLNLPAFVANPLVARSFMSHFPQD